MQFISTKERVLVLKGLFDLTRVKVAAVQVSYLAVSRFNLSKIFVSLIAVLVGHPLELAKIATSTLKVLSLDFVIERLNTCNQMSVSYFFFQMLLNTERLKHVW